MSKHLTPVRMTEREVKMLHRYANSIFLKIFEGFDGVTSSGEYAYSLTYQQVADVYSALAFLEEEGYSA